MAQPPQMREINHLHRHKREKLRKGAKDHQADPGKRGKSRSIFPPPARLFPGEPVSQPTSSHPRPLLGPSPERRPPARRLPLAVFSVCSGSYSRSAFWILNSGFRYLFHVPCLHSPWRLCIFITHRRPHHTPEVGQRLSNLNFPFPRVFMTESEPRSGERW